MLYFDIPVSESWKTVEPLTKGWSPDKKYVVQTYDGKQLLLRMATIDRYEAKKKEYEIVVKYAQAGIVMSQPLKFGVCNQGKNVYMVLSWLDGKELLDVLPMLPEQEQYELGVQAGVILKNIHSIPLAPKDIPAQTKKDKKRMKLLRYEASNVRMPDDELVVAYIKERFDLIWQKEPVYAHGDFHPGNLIYQADGTIGVIDFNRWEVGDPYEEFCKLEQFGIEASIPYCVGQLNAYFDGDVPIDFWRANAVYAAHTALCSIQWAEQFGEESVANMLQRAQRTCVHFNHFNQLIPKWYTDYVVAR